MNRTVASAAARPSLKNWNISVNIRTATTSSSIAPPLIDMTMSKILSVAIAIVVATVMIEPRIIGTITLKNSWRSLAPSSLAASMISVDTPLIAAENTTMAKPVWSQIRITISAGRLMGNAWPTGSADRRMPSRRRSGGRTAAGWAAARRRRTSR